MSTSKLFDLSGRVALVTGGSKGLGLAMARGFAEAGADIVISSRHEDELRVALDKILAGTGRKGMFFIADMSKRTEVEQLAKSALGAFGRVDILVNNAGTNTPQAVDEITDETWDRVMEINLNSIMVLTRALVPPMKERRWGRIIHISSIMGIIAKEKRNIYCATKTALLGFARASALELGESGITVNCIAPGPFLTDLPMSILSDKEKQEFARMTAVNRWGDPKELVGPALLLASDAGTYITGANLVVDGGFVLR
jgi:NAD(P)-dependent dehydrogenase (short-subunit alcohol dehydrogenase family)